MADRTPERSGTFVFGWGALLILTRSVVSAGLLTYAARLLPPEELGVWMVCLSAYSLLGLLEFAVGTTLLRAASMAWSGAREIAAWGLPPTPDAYQVRPPSWDLLRQLRRAGALLGGLLSLAFALGMVGTAVWKPRFFASAAGVAFAITFVLQPLGVGTGPILGGIGRWWEYQAVQMAGWLAHGVVTAFGLYSGFGLAALPCGYAALLLISRSGAWIGLSRLDPGLPVLDSGAALLGRLWPNLWRLLALAVASFLILQGNVVVCASQVGLSAAAVYGFSLQAANLVGQLSAVPVQMQIPQFAAWRAAGQRHLLAAQFARAARRQIVLFAIGALSLWLLGPALLGWLRLQTNLLPAELLASLLLIVFLETHHSQYGSLVLTENRNPFLPPALLSGALVVALGWVLAPGFGIAGILLAQGGVQLAFNNWWTVWRGIQGLEITPGEYGRGFFTGRWPANSAVPPAARAAGSIPAASDPAKAP